MEKKEVPISGSFFPSPAGRLVRALSAYSDANNEPDAVPVNLRPKDEAHVRRARPIRRLIGSLLLVTLVGAPMWVIYGFASGSIAFLGNCGPQGFIGQAGYFAGGSAATLPTAAVVGAVLWVGAGVAVWVIRKTAIVVYAFTILYFVALVVLAVAASTIWGHRHCVMY